MLGLALAVEELLAGLSALVFELVEPFAGLFPLVVDEPADELLLLLFEFAAGLFPLTLEPVAGLFEFTDVDPFVGLLLLAFELADGLLVSDVELSAGLLAEPFAVLPVVPAGFVVELGLVLPLGLLFVEPFVFELAGLLAFDVELSAGLLLEPLLEFGFELVVPAGFEVLELGLLFVEPFVFEPVAGLLWFELLVFLLLPALDAGLLAELPLSLLAELDAGLLLVLELVFLFWNSQLLFKTTC